MTVKGGSSAACAACKYQRRKCAPDCQLAPYFPPDQPRLFQNAHRLFGVSNILKILNRIEDTAQKPEAMRSIICEANIRDRYPVNGCVGVIYDLCIQIHLLQHELDALHAQLAAFRAGHLPNTTNNNSSSQCNVLSLFDEGKIPRADGGLVFDEGGGGGFVDCGDPNLLWGMQPRYSFMDGSNNGSESVAGAPMQSGPFLISSSSHATTAAAAAGPGAAADYDEISPYFGAVDDQHSQVDSKEAYDSSFGSSLTDAIQPAVDEHTSKSELKSAAACFSLTSAS